MATPSNEAGGKHSRYWTQDSALQARVGFTSSTSVSGSVRSKPETGTMSELGG